MIDLIFISGIALLIILFFGLLYSHAEKIYDLQINLKKNDKLSFKLFGSGSNYIDEKEKWIKNYKRYILILGIVIFSIAASMFLGVTF